MTSPTPLHELFSSWGADFGEHQGVTLPLRVAGAGQEYQAAREGVVLADGGDRALLRMSGADLLDFLQRVLTSDVTRLFPGAGQWSAMLDGKGHWISDLLLYRLADQDDAPVVLLDCPASRLEALAQRVDMFHFGERIAWEPLPTARLLVAGAGMAAELGLGPDDDPADRPFGVEEDGDSGLWLQRPDRGVPCRERVGPADAVRAEAERRRSAGAVPTGLVVLDILRVEAGIPRWGTDFDEEGTLPAAGEWHRASLNKGCYSGQELLAKVRTYGEAPRQMCLLEFASGQRPLTGAELRDAEGRPAGTVTSWVWSPLRDKPIGLGTVRRRALGLEQPLTAVLGEEAVMAAWTRPDKVPN